MYQTSGSFEEQGDVLMSVVLVVLTLASLAAEILMLQASACTQYDLPMH